MKKYMKTLLMEALGTQIVVRQFFYESKQSHYYLAALGAYFLVASEPTAAVDEQQLLQLEQQTARIKVQCGAPWQSAHCLQVLEGRLSATGDDASSALQEELRQMELENEAYLEVTLTLMLTWR